MKGRQRIGITYAHIITITSMPHRLFPDSGDFSNPEGSDGMSPRVLVHKTCLRPQFLCCLPVRHRRQGHSCLMQDSATPVPYARCLMHAVVGLEPLPVTLKAP